MWNSKWHIYCATQLPPLTLQGCLPNKVSLLVLDLCASGLVQQGMLKEDILPTIKKLLSSIANLPLKCQINDWPLWRSYNPPPHEWKIFQAFQWVRLEIDVLREKVSDVELPSSQAIIIRPPSSIYLKLSCSWKTC